jgi:hypothetical protein
MTFLVILVSAAIGSVWLNAEGPFIAGSLTVFVAIFVAGLAAASIAAIASGQRRSVLGACVLIANFAGSHWAWADSDPILTSACVDLATALYFVVAGRERWELCVGALCLLSFTAAVLTGFFDIIPDHTERPPGLIVWAFPDISSLCGHLSSVILGAGSGDWGRRVRTKTAAALPWATRTGRLA